MDSAVVLRSVGVSFVHPDASANACEAPTMRRGLKREAEVSLVRLRLSIARQRNVRTNPEKASLRLAMIGPRTPRFLTTQIPQGPHSEDLDSLKPRS